MRLLKNRAFAIFITVVIVILTALFGIQRSLNRLAADVEAMFYEGVYLESEGYTQPSIDSQLQIRANGALALATVMEGYPDLADEAETLLSARRDLISAKSIRDKHSANERMQRAFTTLTAKAGTLDLTERDKEDIDRYISTFQGAQTAILGSLYNQKALFFMDDASFIAHVLRPFLFVTPPQSFV